MTLDDVRLAAARPGSAARPDPGRRLRVAMYSHDSQGLGHTRRNLAIATALSGLDPRPDVLLLTGTPEAAALRRPPGCDLVGLPALGKDDRGGYTARNLSADLSELLALRSAILASTLRSFRPDLLVVDKHPRGAFGELEPALRTLRPGRARTVLGMRDVLDSPASAADDWIRCRGSAALRRWFDAVWAYGDPAIADPTAALELPPDLAGIVTHTGYLAHGREPAPTAPNPERGPFVLGLCGGGSDGVRLAEAFTAAPLPRGVRGVFITGPHMAGEERDRLAAAGARSGVAVHAFAPDVAPWLDHASAVVSMGGYNTVCEALARPAPLLVVPRVEPRAEQLVRARAMAGARLLDMLHPDRLTPADLGRWLRGALARPRRARTGVDLDGLARVPGLALALTGRPAPLARSLR
ncbi:putative glycosyltransferase [Spinactinospora alkalitolerans]|uniref:Putative glycosyltransferase n=1 Tax=Spinactinospora alkalitolerans TaxID=687207 RepID=A0A852U640_9ACTN|nr:hypothetical protein [Spinactinospora alkalitolerans]NYE49544.1 putative glycosyltransferase [Spinactinospora alkalitolerans]